MKKFEDFTKEDLVSLRGQVVLNSIYTSDYANNMFISDDSCMAFFDGYYDYIWELAEETKEDVSDMDLVEFDTPDNLLAWFNCYDDFDWVEYNCPQYNNGALVEIGDEVKWYDPCIDELDEIDQEEQASRIYEVFSINGEVILIADQYGEVEVYASEIEPINKN